MMTGSLPFTLAVPEDKFYKFLCKNRADLFWRYHSKSHLSNEFKDLLTSMLQPIPPHRLTLADVVGHPWMEGEVASPE